MGVAKVCAMMELTEIVALLERVKLDSYEQAALLGPSAVSVILRTVSPIIDEQIEALKMVDEAWFVLKAMEQAYES